MDKSVPKLVKIGPLRFMVMDMPPDKANAFDGTINYNDMVIHIAAESSREYQHICLLHEILHGLDRQLTLDLSEPVVSRLTYGLYQVLTENHIIFREESSP